MGINDNLDKKTVIEDELSKVSGGAKQEVIKQYNIKMPKNPVVAPKNKPGDNKDFGWYARPHDLFLRLFMEGDWSYGI